MMKGSQYDFATPTRAARDLSERYWSGQGDSLSNPLLKVAPSDVVEIIPGRVYFILTLANVVVIVVEAGLVLVDAAARGYGAEVATLLEQAFPGKPLLGIIYTHGHIDHVGGAPEIMEALNSPNAKVYGHHLVNRRFDRYHLTAGYNAHINSRQFSMKPKLLEMMFSDPFVSVTDSYGADGAILKRISLGNNELEVELHHDKGETDDATWVFLPEHQVLIPGDFVIWCCPNCGNPQKAQRYPLEWAAALRKMEAKKPTVMLPGHGPVVWGSDRCGTMLKESAELLESIVSQTITAMNRGLTLNQVLQQVQVSPALLNRPFLRPVYDDPSFIVRNIWRLYGGWYSGFLPDLRPVPYGALGKAVLSLILESTGTVGVTSTGDSTVTAIRRFFHRFDDEPEVALFFLELVIAHIESGKHPTLSPAATRAIYDLRLSVLMKLTDKEISLMGQGIYKAVIAATKSKL